MPISTTNSVQMENNQLKVPQSSPLVVEEIMECEYHPLLENHKSGRKRLKITEIEGSQEIICAQLSSPQSAPNSVQMENNQFKVPQSSLGKQVDHHPLVVEEIMECEYENDKSGRKRLKITEIEDSQEIICTQLSPLQPTISLEISNGNEISMLNDAGFDPYDTDQDFMNELIVFESSLDEPREVLYGFQEKVNEAAPSKYEDFRRRQSNFCKRMLSAATGLPEANCISLMLGTQYLGWLSRLAFGSPRGFVLPLPKPQFCCIFPDFNPIFIRRGLGQNKDKSQVVSSTVDKSLALPAPQESLVGDIVLGITLKEPPALRSPPYVAEGSNPMDAAVMEAFGQAAMLIQSKLFTRLQLMDPSSHDSMVKEANTVFESLDRLKVDYGPFYQRVRDFIGAASSLSRIKLSIHSGFFYQQDYLDLCKREKLRLEQLAAEHASVMTCLTRSQERLQSLENEAEEARNRLLQIEQKISACKMEAKKLNIHLTELSERMGECEDSLLCASLEAEAAQKLSTLRREAELNAARNVFEVAKIQLRDSAG